MNFKRTKLLIAIALVALAACKKSNPDPIVQGTTDIYVAGYDQDANGATIATYWKNGVATKLTNSSTYLPIVTGISVQGSDVYTSGYYYIKSGTHIRSIACYWKNNTINLLTDSLTESRATGIAVKSNDIYVTGFAGNNGITKAVYWKNGIKTTLDANSSSTSITTAIIIQNSDVYITGYTLDNVQKRSAAFWKNGVITKLSDNSRGSEADAITINGSDIYIAGTKVGASAIIGSVTYWKNGIPVTISDGSVNLNTVNGITLIGNDIYTIASISLPDGAAAVYWKNNAMTQLTPGSAYSQANGIAVDGSDIYISGINNNKYATLWKNGTPVQLSQNTSYASCITIVKK